MTSSQAHTFFRFPLSPLRRKSRRRVCTWAASAVAHDRLERPHAYAPYLTLFLSLKKQVWGSRQIDVVILRGGLSIRPSVHVKESKSKPFCDSSEIPHIRNGRGLPCRAVFLPTASKKSCSVCFVGFACHVSSLLAALGISLTQKNP